MPTIEAVRSDLNLKIDQKVSSYRIASPRPHVDLERKNPSELWISGEIKFNYGLVDKGEKIVPMMFREGTFAVRVEDVIEQNGENGKKIIPPLLAFCRILDIEPPKDAKDLTDRFVEELFTKPRKGKGGNFGSHFEWPAAEYLGHGNQQKENAKDEFYQHAKGPENANKCGEITNGKKKIHLHAELEWHNGVVLAALDEMWSNGPSRAGELLEKKGENFSGLQTMSPKERLVELKIEILNKKTETIIERQQHRLQHPGHMGREHEHDEDHNAEHEDLGEELSWKERNRMLAVAMVASVLGVADKETRDIVSNDPKDSNNGTGWGVFGESISQAAIEFNKARASELHNAFKTERAKYRDISREKIVEVLKGMHKPVNEKRQQKFAKEFHTTEKVDWKAFEENVKSRFANKEFFHDIAIYILTAAFAITTDPKYPNITLTEAEQRILEAARRLKENGYEVVRYTGKGHDGIYHGEYTKLPNGEIVEESCAAHPPQEADKRMINQADRNTQAMQRFAKRQSSFSPRNERRTFMGGGHRDEDPNRKRATKPNSLTSPQRPSVVETPTVPPQRLKKRSHSDSYSRPPVESTPSKKAELPLAYEINKKRDGAFFVRTSLSVGPRPEVQLIPGGIEGTPLSVGLSEQKAANASDTVASTIVIDGVNGSAVPNSSVGTDSPEGRIVKVGGISRAKRLIKDDSGQPGGSLRAIDKGVGRTIDSDIASGSTKESASSFSSITGSQDNKTEGNGGKPSRSPNAPTFPLDQATGEQSAISKATTETLSEAFTQRDVSATQVAQRVLSTRENVANTNITAGVGTSNQTVNIAEDVQVKDSLGKDVRARQGQGFVETSRTNTVDQETEISVPTVISTTMSTGNQSIISDRGTREANQPTQQVQKSATPQHMKQQKLKMFRNKVTGLRAASAAVESSEPRLSNATRYDWTQMFRGLE